MEPFGDGAIWGRTFFGAFCWAIIKRKKTHHLDLTYDVSSFMPLLKFTIKFDILTLQQKIIFGREL